MVTIAAFGKFCRKSYFYKSSLEAGKTSDMAEKKKILKYRHLANNFYFIPIGTETLGTFGPEAIKFLEDLGHKLNLINCEKRSKSFLFQSIGISIQNDCLALRQGECRR